MMSLVMVEGWYVDPFGAHEARWFSAGWPTALVRDAGVTAHDQPPSVTWAVPLVAHDLVRAENTDGTDLLRADEVPLDTVPYAGGLVGYRGSIPLLVLGIIAALVVRLVAHAWVWDLFS